MLNTLYRSLEGGSEVLDSLRSRILRRSLRSSILREMFSNRTYRLGTSFLVATLFATFFSVAAPLWMLLIGPLVYGVPHIVSSLRYFHYRAGGAQKRNWTGRGGASRVFRASHFPIVVLLWVFLYRLLFTWNGFGMGQGQLSEWKGSTFIELGATGTTFVVAAALYQKRFRQWLKGAFFLGAFSWVFVHDPSRTLGAMVLLHNFVAFPYWIGAASPGPERRVAWAALALTWVLTAAIMTGGFEALHRWFDPSMDLGFAQMAAKDIGRLILPGSSDPRTALRACTALALGQSLHYFVWLKAVPDQYHYHPVPTSFRQSLRLLEKDFGRAWIVFFCLLSGVVLTGWALVSLGEARRVYFALASFHGYLEIAGLALGREKDSRPHPFGGSSLSR